MGVNARELMVSLWYPAAPPDGPRAPYMLDQSSPRYPEVAFCSPQRSAGCDPVRGMPRALSDATVSNSPAPC